MLDKLIVIASHQGTELLRHSLPKMGKWPVLVVETGTPTLATEQLCKLFPNVGYLCTPYSGYDTGAYLWAYWNVPANAYLFMQDSCCPREPDFMEQFAARMPDFQVGAVGWSSFNIDVWDTDAQRAATEWMYGSHVEWPYRGIFGPIFYTTRRTLDEMQRKRCLPMPPVHKQQQQAMERAWAILFHRIGVSVNFLVEEDMPRGYDMQDGKYPALQKTFLVRQ